MNRQPSRIGLYLILIVALIAGYLYLNNQVVNQSNYTLSALENAAEEGSISSVRIQPNKEVPTGAVVAEVVGQGQKRLFVTDVNEVEDMLRENGIDPVVENVPQDNVLLTTLLPILLSAGLIVFVFVMMNRQMSGGGQQCKNDELWEKPRAYDDAG